MEIQLSNKFALASEIKMSIEIHEYFSLPSNSGHNANIPPVKRGGEIPLQEERPAKRFRYSESEITQSVKVLVHHYGLDTAQEEVLTALVKEHEVVPTVEEVEWVVQEAQLRDGDQALNWPMFYFMEFYPWYLRLLKDDHRVFVGIFEHQKEKRDLWASFTPKSQFHLNGPLPGKQKNVFRLKAELRPYIKWHASFEELFQLSNIKSDSFEDLAGAKKAQQQQTAYIKAVMKVLARFPGLIFDRNLHEGEQSNQLYGPTWDAFPFLNREERSEQNPLNDLFKLLCSIKVGTIKSLKKLREDDEDDDDDED
ncbi:hypothetical protein KCU81_g1501, partial [Aureobasidium melanogenum]|uniref:Uncharacterized protein n=1 Tax=Aureobasidium melanogenum (strain CBS 110374) TaxID=1043003 RepID=A0A074WV53_AURM1